MRNLFGQAGDSTPEEGEGRVNAGRLPALFSLSLSHGATGDFACMAGNGTITRPPRIRSVATASRLPLCTTHPLLPGGSHRVRTP